MVVAKLFSCDAYELCWTLLVEKKKKDEKCFKRAVFFFWYKSTGLKVPKVNETQKANKL